MRGGRGGMGESAPCLAWEAAGKRLGDGGEARASPSPVSLPKDDPGKKQRRDAKQLLMLTF